MSTLTTQRRERIQACVAGPLDAYISRPPDDDSPEALADWKRRTQALAETRQDRIDRTVRQNYYHHCLDDFTYVGLPEILRVANLDLFGMYRLAGVELTFPDEGFREAAMLCERMDEDRLRAALRLAETLSNDFRRDPMLKGPSPSRIAKALYEMQRPCTKVCGPRPASLIRMNSNRKCKVIPALEFPEVASFLGVSLHWLFQFGAASAYGLRPMTETVLDEYSFMSKKNRELFLSYLRNGEKED